MRGDKKRAIALREETLQEPTPKRKDVARSEETFWIVRKPERSNLAIQNTLRRILENYFKILGGIEFDQLCAMFEGKEKLICKLLCSWVHDGSHFENSKHGAHF